MAKLYFYYSAMNAGKTTTLLQSAHNYRERGMRVIILTPRLDHRAGSGVAVIEERDRHIVWVELCALVIRAGIISDPGGRKLARRRGIENVDIPQCEVAPGAVASPGLLAQPEERVAWVAATGNANTRLFALATSASQGNPCACMSTARGSLLFARTRRM